jgi:hypothetical protein
MMSNETREEYAPQPPLDLAVIVEELFKARDAAAMVTENLTRIRGRLAEDGSQDWIYGRIQDVETGFDLGAVGADKLLTELGG